MCRAARLSAGLGLAALLMAGALPSGAASPLLGPAFRVSGGDQVSNEYNPALAWSEKSGEYLAVWTDERDYATRSWDIYGQRVSADGVREGPSFRISFAPGAVSESGPSVAWNSAAGGFLVVWTDGRRRDTRGYDIYGQLVAADGSLQGGNFRVSGPAATANESFPLVVANPVRNEFLVVWVDERRKADRGDDIYGRLLAANGSPLGGDFRVSGAAALDHEGAPGTAWSDETGGYLVAWEDRRDTATCGYDIYGRLLNADGTPAGGDFRLSRGDDLVHETTPAVAWSGGAGEWLVVWGDHRNWATHNWDIYGQRVDADGLRVGPNLRISRAPGPTWEGFPAVAWNEAAGRYLVVWEDARREATRGYDIYGQYLDGQGAPVGSNLPISTGLMAAEQGHPMAAANPASGQNLVVWEDNRREATRGWDIYGQRMTG